MGFEFSALRMDNLFEDLYIDPVEETLMESVALYQRSVEAAERTLENPGIDMVDREGNFIEHVDISRDPEPLRQVLRQAEKNLADYRASKFDGK